MRRKTERQKDRKTERKKNFGDAIRRKKRNFLSRCSSEGVQELQTIQLTIVLTEIKINKSPFIKV